MSKQALALQFRADELRVALAKLDDLLRDNTSITPDGLTLKALDDAENYIRLIRETEKRRSAA
jgi:hypothetical protein|tara:strand:+ start:252 stop:440 length:189 start_codon:yes stop_codon:yes gene_type:complete